MDVTYITMHEGDLLENDKMLLVAGMLTHHASQGHTRPPKNTFSISLKNASGAFIGGIIASVLWNGMEIESLWVHESERGKGYGKRLMELAEQEGIRRGATISYTNTFPWQAPLFYEKLGYTLYGKLEGFPQGNALNYYQKKLK